MRRHLPCLLLCALGASCGGEGVASVAVTLRDPSGIIDSVTPARLRILAIPATTSASGTTYTCDPTSGRVSPEPSTVDGAMIPDSKGDIEVPIHTSVADAMLAVPADDYIILVRGRGTDRVTMVPNTVIASACVHQMIAAGGTQTVNLTLVEIAGSGTCGDGTVSPDEQCDDHNTANGDGCTSSCETEPLDISTAGAASLHPSVSWLQGGTAAIVFGRATDSSIRVRLLNSSGGPIGSPTALQIDQALLASTIDRNGPTQDQPVVSAAGGRVAAAFLDVVGSNFDVSVRFRDFMLMTPVPPDVETVATEAPPATATATRTANAMTQQNPAIGSLADGTTLVVFENQGSTTGLSGRVYAAGATAPSGATPFQIGMGSGGQQPAVGALGTGFAVAYATGSAIFVQKVASAGTTMAPVMLAMASVTPSSPSTTIVHQVAIAALPTCPATGACAIVAWHDTGAAGDGDGSILARMIDGTGSALGMPFAVNTTTAGDQTAPTAAAGNSRFVVGFQDAAGVHARNFDGAGMPALNRSRTPPASTDDYLLAAAGNTFPSVAIGGAANALMAVWQTSDARIQGRTIPLP